MIFIPINSKQLSITIKLNKSYNRSLIGLVNFHMNGLKSPSLVEVTCKQIDSTVENPKRILKLVFHENLNKNSMYPIKTIPFNRVTNTSRDWYLSWESTNIEFYPLDSSDDFLELNITKSTKENLEFMPTDRPGFPDHDPLVLLTLVIKPINERQNK